MRKETYSKATGSMTKPMESASTLISMGRRILVIGSTISSTESAQRKELIIHISRVIIKMDFTMDLEFTLKLTALNIQDSGSKISFMVWVYIGGRMDESIMANLRGIG